MRLGVDVFQRKPRTQAQPGPASLAARLAIRRATPDDAAALQRACWPEWPEVAVHEFLERLNTSAARGRGYPAAALFEGAAVGFGQLTLWRDAAEIGDLIVAPAWRSQGVGTAIIAHLLDKARAWGLTRVEIGAAMSNPRALALYRRLGFAPQRVIDIQLNGGAPEPVMYLAMPLKS
ncbi:MAG: GNAT family N-acetyltransferase [Anaerolineae bacterium]|nr:GNAT family N-acetyltransferase [Anaerolineae bacterium]